MQQLLVIKIGGNIIDDEEKLSSFLKEFASVKANKILVHGGGKLATRVAEQLGIKQQMTDGRRITDSETLKVVTMVYAGYINKRIVSILQGFDCNTIGLTGADGNSILAHKRTNAKIDYGFAGDIDEINHDFMHLLLNIGYALVVSPITHDKEGQLLNTNADTIAKEVAKAMSKEFEVSLVYSFEKAGVLLDVNDESSVIPVLKREYYKQLKEPADGNPPKIFEGMIPKLDNAFAALESGVYKVIIGKAEQLGELVSGKSGTIITNEQ